MRPRLAGLHAALVMGSGNKKRCSILFPPSFRRWGTDVSRVKRARRRYPMQLSMNEMKVFVIL